MNSKIKFTFSQRLGLTSATKEIQLEDMDDDLKNSLWNFFLLSVINHSKELATSDRFYNRFKNDFFAEFLKQPISALNDHFSAYINIYLKIFIALPWYKIYDLLEFFIDKSYVDSDYVKKLNVILEREYSGYRIINKMMAPIANETETASINDAINSALQFTAMEGVNIHLTKALKFLSDREYPDYGNSIKESVSAVETLAKLLTKEGTLGSALNNFENKGLGINSQLKESFNKIYNYSNDKNAGIRHSITGNHLPPDFNTAKYILVTSSAFVNYLISLGDKSGLITKNRRKIQ